MHAFHFKILQVESFNNALFFFEPHNTNGKERQTQGGK